MLMNAKLFSKMNQQHTDSFDIFVKKFILKESIKISYWSLLTHIILIFIKFGVGYYAHSYALIADGFESFGDMLSTIIVIISLYISMKPADYEHPYGHGRIEILATFIIVFSLIASSIFIFYISIKGIVNDEHIVPHWSALLVLLIIIVSREGIYRYVTFKNKKLNNSTLKADAWHHRADALTSLCGLIGVALAFLLGEQWVIADKIAAMIASLFILYNAYKILRPVWGEFMDENLHEDLIQVIRQSAESVPGVLNTEKCLIRKSGSQIHIDLHIIVDGDISVRSGHDIAHDVMDKLNDDISNLGHINIHIEPDDAVHTEVFKKL